MTHTLLLHLKPSADAIAPPLVDWALFDAQNNKLQGEYRQPITSLISQAANDNNAQLVVLIPGEDILQTTLKIPVGQKRHLQRTLPFLVEEHIASPIEDMHLSAGHIHNGEASVLAVSHSALQGWLDLLKQHQLEADWLLPDSAATTFDSSQLQVLIDNDSATFYCHPLPALKTELENLTFIADRFISSFAEGKRPASGTLVMSDSLDEAGKSAAEALATQFEVEGIAMQRHSASHSFDYGCEQLLNQLQQSSSGLPVNLLSGRYRSTTERQRSSAPNWRALVVAVAICIGLKLVFDLGSGLYLNYQSHQVDSKITALYQELFPQDQRIVNAKVQMENHLARLGNVRSGSDFMRLFGHTAQALKSLNAANSAQLQQLRYNDKTQTLLLDIHVRKVQQLEQLKQAIEANNINVSILSANEEQQWIKGRIRLSL